MVTSGSEVSKRCKASAEIVERARKTRKVVKVNYAAEDEELVVALLNSHGDRFVGGLTVHDDTLWAITMEHPGKNSKAVQYVNFKDVPNGKKYLAALAG